MRALEWLRRHDPGLTVLRRSGRAAVVVPLMLALGVEVIGNATVALFAAFGSFSMLLFVDFTGPLRDRARAQAALALAGAVFICLGTLVAPVTWLGVATMAVVAFAVLFSGVVSSVLAGASTSLLLPFILTVSLPGTVSALPGRLAGWGLASVVGVVAVCVLWPTPARDALRARTIAACAAVADQLAVEVARTQGRPGGSADEMAAAVGRTDDALAALHHDFYATAYRPTGLSSEARALVGLVDEIGWLSIVAAQSTGGRELAPQPAACALKLAAAAVLRRGASLLADSTSTPRPLHDALHAMDRARAAVEREAMAHLPAGRTLISSLDPAFRAQEVSFAVAAIAGNIDRTAQADRRTWLERLMGHQPSGLISARSAAWNRARAHLEPHSVWLHNSLRAAIGLALAVLVADLTEVQHSFWVVLGTLAVLRSNILTTGQNVLRGLLGTLAGIVVGGLIVAALSQQTALLWAVLPPAILFAGLAPATISFAAGQAGFTVTLVVLFNIISPAGPSVGLVRIEDVAIGSAVSLVVGLLFWPRGAARALRATMAEAYSDAAAYLRAAVEFGVDRGASGTPAPAAPQREATRASGSASRLDDAFRTFLGERGAKPVSLVDMTTLVTGVAGLRLAADAVLDLWNRGGAPDPGDRSAARDQLRVAGDHVAGWYAGLGAALSGDAAMPASLPRQPDTDGVLIEAVRAELLDPDGRASATAVRMVWTGEHLDAARRLQATLVEPARAVTDRATRHRPRATSRQQNSATPAIYR